MKCHFKAIVGSTPYLLVYNESISFLFGKNDLIVMVTETLFDDLQQHVQGGIVGYKRHPCMSHKDTLLDSYA